MSPPNSYMKQASYVNRLVDLTLTQIGINPEGRNLFFIHFLSFPSHHQTTLQFTLSLSLTHTHVLLPLPPSLKIPFLVDLTLTQIAVYPEPLLYPLPIFSLPLTYARARTSHSHYLLDIIYSRPRYPSLSPSLPPSQFHRLMAMSRILSQSLPRASLHPSTTLISHRHRSSKPRHVQLIELDLDAASPSQPDSSEPAAAEVVPLGMKKLEEAIHSIIVRRAAPDWLPFLPGYSYFVPPRAASTRNHPTGGMIEAIHRLTSYEATRNHRLQHELLSEDEQMSLISAKGWPSSAYFIEGHIRIVAIVDMQSMEKVKAEAKLKEEE